MFTHALCQTPREHPVQWRVAAAAVGVWGVKEGQKREEKPEKRPGKFIFKGNSRELTRKALN